MIAHNGIAHELSALLAIAQRDFSKLLHDRVRLIVSLAFPLILLVGLGPLLSSSGHPSLATTRIIVTGVLAAALFQSTAAGMVSLVTDRQGDFSQVFFVAPISRIVIVGGKILGEAWVALVEAAAIVVVAALMGALRSPDSVVALILPCIACCITGGAFGLLTMATLRTPRSAMDILQFLLLPQYALAGVVAPLHTLPPWLSVISQVTPLRYCVDLMRAGLAADIPGVPATYGDSPRLALIVVAASSIAMLCGGTVLLTRAERSR